jgi:putative cofactor-binding repeat protein
MEIDVVLCNHAETAENRLYVAGGGINLYFVPPSVPHVITVGLGCVIHVPYLATNANHHLRVALIDQDAEPVAPWSPKVDLPAVESQQSFNIGRPPIIEVGDEQTVAMALNFPNLPLRSTGLYEFEVTIDGNVMRRMPFRVGIAPSTARLRVSNR